MHRTHEYIVSLPSCDLRSIIRSTNPAGEYRIELDWAKAELRRRQSAHNNAVHRQWHAMECL